MGFTYSLKQDSDFVTQNCIDWLNQYYGFVWSDPLTQAETDAYYAAQKYEHNLIGKGYHMLFDKMHNAAWQAHLDKKRLLVVNVDNELHFAEFGKQE